MVSAARLFGLATACTALLTAGLSVDGASAQDVECKADVVTAAGRSKFRILKNKALEGRGSAMNDAVATWQRDVAERYGERWREWSRAKDTSFNCESAKPGTFVGNRTIGCTISGRPCALVVPAGAQVADDDDRGSEKGLRDQYAGRSWAYKRAMTRQEQLQAQRDRAEERGWEREKAFQRQLEKERERFEARERNRTYSDWRYRWDDE